MVGGPVARFFPLGLDTVTVLLNSIHYALPGIGRQALGRFARLHLLAAQVGLPGRDRFNRVAQF